MANDMYDLKKSWSVFTSARSRAHKMPVFETSDFSCPKNLTEFQVQVGLKIGYSHEIYEILWKSHGFMDGLWQSSAFSIWNCHFGDHPPRGFGSRLSWKPRRLWSSGTGEGALGEAPALCSAGNQWIPWVFTGQNGQKGMIIWGCPRKNKSEKKWCIASCDLKQETLAFRTFLRTNSQKFLKYPIPNIWYWSQRLILPSGTKSLKHQPVFITWGIPAYTLNWDPKLAPLGKLLQGLHMQVTNMTLCTYTYTVQMWSNVILNVIEYSSYVHYKILYIAVCVYIYIYMYIPVVMFVFGYTQQKWRDYGLQERG